MKKDPNFIDELVKKRLDNYEKPASNNLKRKLFWLVFLFNFKWLFALGTLAGIAGIAVFMYLGETDHLNILPGSDSSIVIEQQIVSTENLIDTNPTQNELTSVHRTTGEVVTNIAPEGKVISGHHKKDPRQWVDPELLSDDNQPTAKLVEIIETEQGSSVSEISKRTSILSLSNPLESESKGNTSLRDVNAQKYGDPWFSVTIYAGPAYSNVFVSGISSEYVDQRKTYESNRPGWSVGTDFKFHLDRWVLSTGLNYSVYNQKRDYSYSYQEYLPDDSYYHYDSTWIWVHETPTTIIPVLIGVDSTWVEVYADHKVDNRGTNQVRYFEIPFIVGYVFNRNLFSMELNAGVSVGILNYAQISVPSFSNYNEIGETKQINQTMLNVMANATFYYHLNQKVSLLVSPYYKQSLQSIFNSNYPVNQRYGTMGVQFGVNILF
jgi:hypothetical protein